MPRTSAVRPEEIRRHNLGLVLAEIHRHGELTRAELTAVLGLNRSTIGGLVTDLANLGMVTEYVPAARDRAGRPSYVVAPRPDGPYVLAVGVEVERIVSAAVALGGRVHARRQTIIEGAAWSPAEVARQIARDARWLAGRLPGHATLIGAGVSVPGTVRRRDGLVEHAPNLAWREVPFAAILTDRLGGIDVQVGNDANLGALAEHQRGAGVGLDNVIYISGSVGIGGGIIADGAELHGVGGYAGEIGHMMLNPEGPPCHCGSNGCIETYIGEHALLRAAGVPEPFGPAAVASVFAAAGRGEARALAAIEQLAVWLGRTLATLVNVFNPQAVIVGGFLSEVVHAARLSIEIELDRRSMTAARAGVRILTPGLGDDSALIGASELAFQSLLAAPDAWTASTADPLAN